jgi:hypothetical protein
MGNSCSARPNDDIQYGMFYCEQRAAIAVDYSHSTGTIKEHQSAVRRFDHFNLRDVPGLIDELSIYS